MVEKEKKNSQEVIEDIYEERKKNTLKLFSHNDQKNDLFLVCIFEQ